MHTLPVVTKAWMQQSVQRFLCGDIMLRHLKREMVVGHHRVDPIRWSTACWWRQSPTAETESSSVQSQYYWESILITKQIVDSVCANEFQERWMLCIRIGWCEDVQQQCPLCADIRMILFVDIPSGWEHALRLPMLLAFWMIARSCVWATVRSEDHVRVVVDPNGHFWVWLCSCEQIDLWSTG